jgi:hypothetical protein
MSKFIDAEGHFDHVGQKLIGTSSPNVVNGDKAKALWLLLADQKQTDLLFWGPSFAVIAGEAGKQFGTEGSAESGVLTLWVPAFCDRLAFDVMAKGSGDVVFQSAYTVAVAVEYGLPAFVPGSKTNNLLSVTGGGAGNSFAQKITFTKAAGVDLRCVVVHFLRSAQEIS